MHHFYSRLHRAKVNRPKIMAAIFMRTAWLKPKIPPIVLTGGDVVREKPLRCFKILSVVLYKSPKTRRESANPFAIRCRQNRRPYIKSIRLNPRGPACRRNWLLTPIILEKIAERRESSQEDCQSRLSLSVHLRQRDFCIPFVVEAATSLSNPVWVPLQTNTMGTMPLYFTDQQWMNYPGRFYRVTSE